MACFIYGDYEGLWIILEKPFKDYLNHGFTWYCECVVIMVNETKSGTIHIRESKEDINKINKTLASLIHFFPGFGKFFIQLPETIELISVTDFLQRTDRARKSEFNVVNFNEYTQKIH